MATNVQEGAEKSAAHFELAELRLRAAELEAKLRADFPSSPAQESAPVSRQAVEAAVAERWAPPRAQTPHPAAPVDHLGAVTLKLSPEEHDEKMGELIGILQERGVSRAIAAAEATGNPHLIDDFQRVLVEYVHEGLPAKNMPGARTPLAHALGLSLLEVTLPARTGKEKEGGGDPQKDVHNFISLMEQFYRGTLSLGRDAFFSFEIANAAGACALCGMVLITHS